MIKKIKYIFLILLSVALFATNSTFVYAHGSGIMAPITTPAPKNQTEPEPSDTASVESSKESDDKSTSTVQPNPSTVEETKIAFNSFDELLEHYLTNVEDYKEFSDEKKDKIRAYIHDDQYCSSADREEVFKEYQYTRCGDMALRNLIKKAVDFFEVKGGQVINEAEINAINDSESIAAGDMYAHDYSEAGGIKIAKSNGRAGKLEEHLAEFVAGVGDSLNNILIDCDASLDNLIYGRLIKYGTNYYYYEHVKGNPYGIIASYVYIIFRNIAIPIIFIFIFFRFVKSAWNSGSSKQRRELVDGLTRGVFVLGFLALMPWFVDAMIAFKDILLNYFNKSFNGNMSDLFGLSAKDNTTIVGYYRDVYTHSKRFVNAALYLGTVCITIFYAVTYISTAVATMVNVIFFPFVAVFSLEDSKLTNTWFKEMIGNIFNPVLDCVLLLMPMIIQQLCGGDLRGYLITLLCSYSIIPSRSIIRRMLGVGGSMRSELLGFGALMAAGRMMSGISRRAKNGISNTVGAIKDAKENHDLANMYSWIKK